MAAARLKVHCRGRTRPGGGTRGTLGSRERVPTQMPQTPTRTTAGKATDAHSGPTAASALEGPSLQSSLLPVRPPLRREPRTWLVVVRHESVLSKAVPGGSEADAAGLRIHRSGCPRRLPQTLRGQPRSQHRSPICPHGGHPEGLPLWANTNSDRARAASLREGCWPSGTHASPRRPCPGALNRRQCRSGPTAAGPNPVVAADSGRGHGR